MTEPTNPRAIEATGSGAWRWGLAASVVACAYAGAVWLAMAMPAPEATEGAVNEAVMIELEPLVAEVEAPPPAPEPAPEPKEPVAETPPEPTPPPPEPAPPEPEVEQPPPPPEVTPPPEPEPEPPVVPEPPVEEPPPVEPPPVIQPEPLPEPEKVVPELPEIETQSDAIINAPIPMAKPTPPRPKPPVKEKKQERQKPKKVAVQPPKRVAPKASTAPRSESAAASNSAAAPRVSPASWQRQAVSHFRKFRRQVAVRVKGVARVAVTIDRGGRVLSARIASSSGNADFDQEAIALVRRASPIPAPPEGVGGRTLSLTVPVNM